jgi:hypothetical protein
VVWSILAAVNLTAGLVVSSLPPRQSDLETMRRWTSTWLAGGTDIYDLPDEAPDYPPNAIVILAPLALLPASVTPPVWATMNLVLAPTVAFLAVRTAGPSPAVGAVLPGLMFLCWGGFRTLLQFTLLTLAFGLSARRLADRSRVASGVCLGLSLIKPHIAAPFLLWAMFARKGRELAIAAAVSAVGFLVYCRVAQSPASAVLNNYRDVLARVYGGDSLGLVGLTNLRPLFELITGEHVWSALLSAAVALLLLALVCSLGIAEGSQAAPVRFSAPALGGLWSLLTFYHLTYNFLLALPAAALLFCTPDPPTKTLRLTAFWVVQAMMMFDPPGLWRRVGAFFEWPAEAGGLVMHADRALVLGLYVLIMTLGLRRLRVARRTTGLVPT